MDTSHALRHKSVTAAAGFALALAVPSFGAVVTLPTTLNHLTPANTTANATGGLTVGNFAYPQNLWTLILGINTNSASTIKVADAAVSPGGFQGIAFEAGGSNGELSLNSGGYKNFLVGYAVTANTAITSVDLELNATHTGTGNYIAAVGEVVTTKQYSDPISALFSPGATTISAFADGSASDSTTDHSIKSISGSPTTLYVWKDILLAECGNSYDHNTCSNLIDDWKGCVTDPKDDIVSPTNRCWTNWCDFNPPKDSKSSITINSVVQSFETGGNQGGGVPEPASLGMLGVGALGLMLRRRSRA